MSLSSPYYTLNVESVNPYLQFSPISIASLILRISDNVTGTRYGDSRDETPTRNIGYGSTEWARMSCVYVDI